MSDMVFSQRCVRMTQSQQTATTEYLHIYIDIKELIWASIIFVYIHFKDCCGGFAYIKYDIRGSANKET